jgi:cell division protein ZapA
VSNVNLHIGGRTFAVACAPGEEEHIIGLGRVIDEKVRTLGTAANQNETRMLLFASIVLADELHEARNGPGAPPPTPPPPPPPPPPPEPVEDEELAARLEAIASALEKCASALETLADEA